MILTDGSELRISTAPSALVNDLKLFATTFFGGFLFMAVYLA